MRILAVGDIVGESGVRKLKEELPRIKREEKNKKYARWKLAIEACRVFK